MIGAIGDVVSDFVNWYTVWLGNNAQDSYQTIKGLLSKGNKVENVKQAVKANREKRSNSSEEAAGFHDIADVEKRSTVPVDFNIDRLSEMQAAIAEEKYKPVMILKAAQQILKHLDEKPPKRYSFQEWSWLLKLLGEDEAEEQGHRRVGQPVPDGVEVISPVRDHKDQVWSWLGQESPLMSLEEGESSTRSLHPCGVPMFLFC